MRPGIGVYEPMLHILPDWYPVTYYGPEMTEEVYKNRIESDKVRMQLTAIEVGKQYDLGSWFSLSQLTTYPIQDWLGYQDEFIKHFGLPEIIVQAIAIYLKEYADKQNAQAREAEMQYKLSQLDVSNSMSAARRTTDALSKTYGG